MGWRCTSAGRQQSWTWAGRYQFWTWDSHLHAGRQQHWTWSSTRLLALHKYQFTSDISCFIWYRVLLSIFSIANFDLWYHSYCLWLSVDFCIFDCMLCTICLILAPIYTQQSINCIVVSFYCYYHIAPIIELLQLGRLAQLISFAVYFQIASTDAAALGCSAL